MNLEDVINPEYGLQQDEWSLSKPTFGDEGQLEVVGWSGKNSGIKYYILKCSKCSQDSELFGEGYFRSLKGSLGKGCVPCGCNSMPRWTKEQYFVLCSRKAKELGYTFLGFEGEWKGAYTTIRMLCGKHGEWGSGRTHTLINAGYGCPWCAGISVPKSDAATIDLFFASNSFPSDTKFWRSERRDVNRAPYWHVFCPECGVTGESQSGNLQRGQRPCACSGHRQREAYINLIMDGENKVAIKFGIANNSNRRVKQQDTKSAYEVRQYQVYSFPSVASCKQAERECKKELDTGVVLKRDMPDGWTETTWSYNIGKVKSIYECNGGVLVCCSVTVK